MKQRPTALRSRPLLWDFIINSSCPSPTACLTMVLPSSCGGVLVSAFDISVAYSCLHVSTMIGSVGMLVIQLAKLSGLTVITTASPRNHEYLKSLGANYVLPYNDPNTPAEIKKITNGQLYLAYDTISEKGTTQLVIDALGCDPDIPVSKKKEVVLLLPPGELDEKANSVTRHLLQTYTLFGKEVTSYGAVLPANPADYAFSIHSYEVLEQLLTERKLRHQNIKVLGGLEKVPEGFAYMKEGKNSAEKIVYHPSETSA
jgi:NADPH:quinone reductase-like Zn-dependent oxidoreductase